MNNTYRIASLFSGCGGMDLGFSGGFKFHGTEYPPHSTKIVYANDFDHDAVTCFNANLPKYDPSAVCTEKDIRDVRSEDIPDFDILLAGFPCQPFSNAGSRGGVNDKHNRGTLFEECERIIEAKVSGGSRPAAFVFENVRGILSSKMNDGTPVVEEIAKRMQALGYHTTHKLVCSSDYGVPQKRYRVLIIGVDAQRFSPFQFSLMDETAKNSSIPSTKNTHHEKLLLGSILNHLGRATCRDDSIWEYTQATQSMVDQIGPCVHGVEALAWFGDDCDATKLPATAFEGRSWKDIPYENLRPRFKKIADNPKRYHAPRFFRRFAFGEINGTITASAQPENCGITHPVENRRFSVAEAAAIQSFPVDYDFTGVQIPARYKVIGNAVPPVLAWVIASALIKHLES